MAVKYAGIDISYCQPNVDYKALAAGTILGSKIKFVMIRAAYGKTEDKYFKKHVEGCIAAGLNVGLYVYSTAKTTAGAKAEAKFVLDLIKKYGFDGKIKYPIAYDLEENSQANLGQKMCTDMVNAFCDEIKANNYYPILYTNLAWSMWSKFIDINQIPYDLWIAAYVKDTTMAPYLSKASMWQYGVAGHPSFDIKGVNSVPGINGQCDVNWSYVGYASKIKKLGMNKLKTVEPTYTITDTATKLSKSKANTIKNMCTANGMKVEIKQDN